MWEFRRSLVNSLFFNKLVGSLDAAKFQPSYDGQVQEVYFSLKLDQQETAVEEHLACFKFVLPTSLIEAGMTGTKIYAGSYSDCVCQLQARQTPINMSAELEDNCAHVDVRDFTEAMWMKQTNRIDYDSAQWKNFTRRVRDDLAIKADLQKYQDSRNEVDLCSPFTSLFTRITDLFHDDLAFEKQRKPLFHALENTVIKCAPGSGESEDVKPSQRTPDGVGVVDIGIDGEISSSLESWRNVVLCMKFRRPTAAISLGRVLASDTAQPASNGQSPPWCPRCSRWSAPESLFSERSEPIAREESKEIGQNLTSEDSIMKQSKMKRSRINLGSGGLGQVEPAVPPYSGGSSHVAHSIVDTQSSTRTAEEQKASELDIRLGILQLSNYAREIFHALGNRIHSFGVLAIESRITLAYFDRGGAVLSTFNLDDEFDEFIKFVVAFSALDTRSLGFNVHLQPPNGANHETKSALPQKDLRGFTMTVNDKQVTLKGLLVHRPGIMSRGTMVYLGNIEGTSDDVAIKLSWQPCERTPEWEYIEHARRNHCPEDYLIEVYASRRFEDLALSKGFRSHFLNKGVSLNFEDRELRVLVSERLFFIGNLPSEPFMHALWHLFGCVRHLDKAGIRHRDVSSGNTGWNIRDTPTGKRFVALLYDFDLAKYIGLNQEQLSPCRTGTTPFMAIGLLRNPSCDHFLRFDFESLFWLGVYWSLGYNDQGEKVTNPVDLEEWSKRDFKEVARLKALYLTFVIVPARRNPSMFLGIDNLRGAFHHLYNEGTTLVAAAMQAELQNGLQLLSLNDGKAPELLHLTAYDKLEGVVTMWQPEHRIPSPELISIRESRLAE